MLKLLIWGILGKMGRFVLETAQADGGFEIIGGVDAVQKDEPKVYTNPSDIKEDIDVIIDFSRAAALEDILAFALKKNAAVVLVSTGYSGEQLKQINEASYKLAIFRSGNMSVGVNVISDLVRQAAEKLGESFDIEIIEKHHNKKVDSPSGTAVILADSALKGRPDISQTVYGRHSDNNPRKASEIGIHSVRGGTIVGEHTVIFAGSDEIIEISHTALSRQIFATGAVRAAKFIANRKPGLYGMKDLLN